MPFTKVGKNKYVSPSGRTFDKAQVQLYYANGGKFPGQKSDSGGVLSKTAMSRKPKRGKR